jgi:hydrogenase maturation protease
VKKTLVIGYGNTMRSDDGVGVWIANKIGSLNFPDIEVRTFHQLGMELVPDLISYDRVIFADGAVEGEPTAHRTCVPSDSSASTSEHNITPEYLQRLALDVFGLSLDVHLFTARGDSFEFGFDISPAAQRRADDVIIQIISLLRQLPENVPAANFASK